MYTPSDSADTTEKKPRLLGINHVTLEVDDIDAALAFYGRIFTFTLRGRHQGMAFIDLGDQFTRWRNGAPSRRTRNGTSA